MKRSTLDKVISSVGLVVAVFMLMLSGALFWGSNFIHSQVTDQLSQQNITFPTEGSEALLALPAEQKDAMMAYAGQQLTTGAQAKVYANDFIAVHLEHIGGGKTYAQLSAASMANPTDQALVGQVQTVFRGETLRGLLLNAYAFDTMATVARFVALVSLAAGVALLALAGLGFRHAGTVKKR